MALTTVIFVGDSKEWIPDLVAKAKELQVNEGTVSYHYSRSAFLATIVFYITLHYLSRPSLGYTNFQCYVHGGHLLSSIFQHPSFDVLSKMAQLQPIQTGVCFMSLLWK